MCGEAGPVSPGTSQVTLCPRAVLLPRLCHARVCHILYEPLYNRELHAHMGLSLCLYEHIPCNGLCVLSGRWLNKECSSNGVKVPVVGSPHRTSWVKPTPASWTPSTET